MWEWSGQKYGEIKEWYVVIEASFHYAGLLFETGEEDVILPLGRFPCRLVGEFTDLLMLHIFGVGESEKFDILPKSELTENQLEAARELKNKRNYKHTIGRFKRLAKDYERHYKKQEQKEPNEATQTEQVELPAVPVGEAGNTATKPVPAAETVDVAMPADETGNAVAQSKPKRKRVYLSAEMKKEILEYARRNPSATKKDIAKRFGINPKTLSQNKTLKNLIDSVRIGGEIPKIEDL